MVRTTLVRQRARTLERSTVGRGRPERERARRWGPLPCLTGGESRKLDPRALVKASFDKALEAQYPLAVENVARLRRVHPDRSPEDLLSYLTKIYLGAVAGAGAGAGAAAAVPNGWVQVPAAFAHLLAFLEAAVLYTLSVSEVHGLDVERRRLLVTSVLVRNSAATATLEPLIGRSVPYWGRQIVKAIPMSAVNKANKVLGPRFVTKYGTKQGLLVLGKQVPLFIGAGIGAGGNGLFGWLIVKASRRVLGPPPESWNELRAPIGVSNVSLDCDAAVTVRELPGTFDVARPDRQIAKPR